MALLAGQQELERRLGKPFRGLAKKFLLAQQPRPDMGAGGVPSDPMLDPEETQRRRALQGGRGYINPNSARAVLF